MFQIITDRGLRFNVRIVAMGDLYGLNDCKVHDEVEPMVEFYDDRYHEGFGERGQFVSRYYASTLLGHGHTGLCLDGGVPDWSVDTLGMLRVQDYLQGYLAGARLDIKPDTRWR
jgi:hypothetical protein